MENVSTAVRTCRLLYYGAAGVGKRDNLGLIHRTIPPDAQLNVAVEDPERQIAFRFAQPDGESWQVLVQAVDAGQEKPRIAGMADRPPFDAIVFTIDSGAAHLDQSLAAFESLKSYLESWDRDLLEVPVVLQYNRRSTPNALPVDRLESLLNPWGLLAYPADSLKGEGVRETLKSILGLGIHHLKSQAEATPPPAPQPAVPPAAPQAPENTADLGLDYGPPVPGTEVPSSTMARSDAIMDELRPPVVIPVKVPRRLLEGDGPVRILLEVQVSDEVY